MKKTNMIIPSASLSEKIVEKIALKISGFFYTFAPGIVGQWPGNPEKGIF